MSDECSLELFELESRTLQEESIQPEQSERPEPPTIYLCRCLLDSEEIILPPRKKHILTTVTRTEDYLRERRIPELIRFLLTKVIAASPSHPVAFLEKLLNDSMLFRKGHGQAPVLYEDRHLQAVLKSFDPGNRGWLSSGQLRRAFNTLGLTFKGQILIEERIPTDVAFNMLKETQEKELFKLLSAGFTTDEDDSSKEDINTNDSTDLIGIPTPTVNPNELRG